jgi:PTH1 family peptidyl-tRNA hydrolase
MLLVVGLGNPGKQYAGHRHSVGFQVLDELSRRTGAEPFRGKFGGLLARATLADREALLLKPMTYMNLSGDSVQPCAAFFRIDAGDILVVHDELDLPFGTLRLKHGGGHAGHNGLRSLVGRVGTADFRRLRVGIGRPPADFRGEVADWVLTDFTATERAALPKYLESAAESVLDVAARGFEAAMKTRNTRPNRPSSPVEATDETAPASADGAPTPAPPRES